MVNVIGIVRLCFVACVIFFLFLHLPFFVYGAVYGESYVLNEFEVRVGSLVVYEVEKIEGFLGKLKEDVFWLSSENTIESMMFKGGDYFCELNTTLFEVGDVFNYSGMVLFNVEGEAVWVNGERGFWEKYDFFKNMSEVYFDRESMKVFATSLVFHDDEIVGMMGIESELFILDSVDSFPYDVYLLYRDEVEGDSGLVSCFENGEYREVVERKVFREYRYLSELDSCVLLEVEKDIDWIKPYYFYPVVFGILLSMMAVAYIFGYFFKIGRMKDEG